MHKEINRICICLNDRVRLRGRESYLPGLFSNWAAVGALKKHHFVFSRIRNAAARNKVSEEGSLVRI